jgi:uncharacterized protein DUF4932/Big-like domain-containing protein
MRSPHAMCSLGQQITESVRSVEYTVGRKRSVVAALVVGCLVYSCGLDAAEARADDEQAAGPAVRVTVDPRVELMTIIFRLAGNPEYGGGRVKSYVDDVEEHFGEFRNHAVVKLARRLRGTRGVSYDAVMSMAVHLSDAYEVGEKVPFAPRPKSLDERWTADNAREFLDVARRFVKDARFEEFIEAHGPIYETAETRMTAVLNEHGHLKWFDEFFGSRPGARFTLALGMLNGGQCYGPHFDASDGTQELYCVLGVWLTDDGGLPRFNSDVLETVVHEFCHSYTNPIVDRHEDELRPAGEKIFPHVARAMKRQAYGTWKTMMYESLVRACTVRYTLECEGRAAAEAVIRAQERRQFAWVRELSDLLGEYEADRGRYPTLEAFSGRIVKFFDAYADRLPKQPSGSDATSPRVVSIAPTDGATEVDPALTKIKVVFDRPMQDKSWSMVGGGPHFPEITGRCGYDSSKKVWTVPVKLKPNWKYSYQLNSGKFQGFRSRKGVPLKPVTVAFETGKGE